MTEKPITKGAYPEFAERAGTEKAVVGRVLDAMGELVTRTVAEGGAVALPRLGKFACRSRPERTVRNPGTGEQLTKPADRAVKVTIAKPLRDAVKS